MTVPDDLPNAITTAIRDSRIDVAVLPAALVRWWWDKLLAKHVDPVESLWVWEGLRQPATWTEYGADGAGGLAAVTRATRDWGPCVLIATDEGQDADGVGVIGDPEALSRLIGELRPFEFVVLDLTGDRCLIDTHLNSFAVRDPGPSSVPMA